MSEDLNICRTCLSEQNEMFSLFTSVKLKSQEGTLSFAEMLSNLFIQVTADDGLPNFICKSCSKILNLTYIFKQQCEQADIWLQEHFRSNLVQVDVVENSVDMVCKEENSSNNVNINIIKNNDLEEIPDYSSNTLEQKSYEKHSTFSEHYRAKHIRKYQKLQLPEGFEVCEDPRDKQIKVYKCIECNKIFKNNTKCLAHKRTHRVFTCNLCNRSFRSPHGLSYHVKQHQGIRKYVCTYENCNKSFIIKQGLDKHKTQHFNEKNHLCNLCGKAYNTADSLSYHLRAHRGERPHLCTYCGKTFKQKCHLKTHMWNHTGIKRYLCSSCGKRYTTGHHLKKHLSRYCGVGNVPSEPLVRTKKALKKEKMEHEESYKIVQKSCSENEDETNYVVIEAIVVDDS